VTRFIGTARHRPIAAIYAICFLISWGLWLPLILTGGGISELFAAVGLFAGPGLACILVARIATPSGHVRRRVPFRLALVGAWIPCAIILAGYQLETSPNVPLMAQAVSALLASGPAFIVASALVCPPGMRAALASMVRPGGSPGWHALAFLLPPVMQIISVWISEAVGW
jgi:hypothetical protein